MYLFRTDFSEPKIMLHLHKKLGKFMQFGGHIELDETPWQAVKHELREESGYDLSQVRLLQPKLRLETLTDAAVHPTPAIHSTHLVTDGHYHTDSAYVITTGDEPAGSPDEGESNDIQLFTRSEIVALPPEQILDNVREGILYMFDSLLPNWESVTPDTFK
jgi:8-oxo-dGTP pyrophosphatase MutT (NUDIX family)